MGYQLSKRPQWPRAAPIRREVNAWGLCTLGIGRLSSIGQELVIDDLGKKRGCKEDGEEVSITVRLLGRG